MGARFSGGGEHAALETLKCLRGAEKIGLVPTTCKPRMRITMKKEKKILLGAHMSIAGGIEHAFYNGASIGCTAIQFFTHSNRQWSMKPLSPQSIEATKKARQETGIEHAVVHASYLINLASETALTTKQSIITLKKELENCHLLGITSLVLHPGTQSNPKEAIERISEGLNECLADTPDSTEILIETMAGQGGQVGYQFEQLALIKSKVQHKKRIGFCIDTCHLWAAGYDFSTEKGYLSVMHEFDSILGLTHLKAMHLNDSKKRLGSRVDRHEEIGKGTIGLEAFRLIMNDKRLADVPKILETPKNELEDYAHNMKILVSLTE